LAQLSQNQHQPVVHRTLSGAQAGPAANSLLSRKSEGTVAIIHQTVRCAPDCPVSQTTPAANGRLRDQRTIRGQANGRMVTPDCPVCTGQCTNGSEDPTVGFASIEQELFMSGGAPDCPVRHLTEGKNCLPI
jgi:hypothetical protein